MDITLYNFNKRTNSLKRPNTQGINKTVTLKQEVSLFHPIFILKEYVESYNYIKWGSRYYYINDVRYIRTNYIELSCDIDVLATYRNQILNSSQFVLYSSSTYNKWIVDSRLSLSALKNVTSSTATIFTESTHYILEYVTSSPTFGPSGCVVITSQQAYDLAQTFSNTDFIETLVNLQKSLNSAYDAFLRATRVPFNCGSGVSQNIVLGSYSTSVSGEIPDLAFQIKISVSIPWQYNDFRNLNPFTSVLLFLPGYGYMELNPSDLIGQDSISITLNVNGATGVGTYQIGNLASCNANFGTNVSIGTVSQNASAVIGGASSMIIGGATGNGAVVGAGLLQGAIGSIQRSVGSTGGIGGSYVYTSPSGISNFNKVHLYVISHNTNVDPSNLTEKQGRPLFEVKTLTSLSGYCQCMNASVDVENEQMNDTINNLLNGGVYIE